MIYCDCVLCIYQQKGRCTLEEVYLDAGGACREGTLVNVSDEILLKLKKEVLERLEE